MQTAPKLQTRREFVSGLLPGWLRWARIKPIAYAAALVGLLYPGVSTLRELGVSGTLQSTGVLLVLLALVYAGDHLSAVTRGLLKRSSKGVQAVVNALGRVLSYVLLGLCGIVLYQQWQADGDIVRVLVTLALLFALQLRDEMEKDSE